MNKTYEQIMEEMKNAYFSECGEKLDDYSQTAKRLEAVAGELYAISCYGDYIFRQAFIQTATKENLDRHGQVRNCVRKTAAKASGTLTFYIDQPAEEKIEIAEGTVCSAEKFPYIQFAVTQSGSIEAGQTGVTLPAEALSSGSDYNLESGTVTVMVNAPVGVSGVRNDIPFTGGYDDESDSAYRQRILAHYSVEPNGVNAQSIANAVLQLDFVTDCYIPDADTPGKITTVVATKNNLITAEQTEQVKKAVGIDELTGVQIDVQLAQPQEFSIVIEAYIRSGFDKENMKTEMESTVREICSACRIGEALMLNTVSKKLAAVEEISSFNIYSNDAYGDVVPCASKSYLYLENLAVNCFDE